MAKFYEVKRSPGCGGLWAAYNKAGEQVTPLRGEKSAAYLDGHHWSYAPTPFKALGFKPVNTGSNIKAWQARPYWGIKATIVKGPKSWFLSVSVDGGELECSEHRTRNAAAEAVRPYGRLEVETRNILNREAGPIMIARSERGGCTDPGTETYHCM